MGCRVHGWDSYENQVIEPTRGTHCLAAFYLQNQESPFSNHLKLLICAPTASFFFSLCLAGMLSTAEREVSISCMSVAPATLISISLRHYIIISFSVSCLLFHAHACLIKTPPAKFIFFFSPPTLDFFFHCSAGKSITYTNLNKVYQSNLACNYCII